MELLHRVFYTLVGAATFVFFIVKISLSHWKKRGILHEKPKFFWGNLKTIPKKQHIAQLLTDLYEKYKTKAPFIGFYAFLKPMLLILDLDLVQQILNLDAAFFMERGLYSNIADDPLSSNLLQLDDKKYQELHKKLTPCYAAGKMELLLPTLGRVASRFASSLEKLQNVQPVFNINDLVECYNIDALSLIAFGFESDTLTSANTEFRLMSKSYWRNCSYLKAFLAIEFPNLARLFQYKLYDQLVTEYFLKLVNDKVKEREWNRNSYYNYDFLNIIATTKKQLKHENRLSNEYIAAHGFSHILIGLEAYNSTMAFCLYELALQPDLQQKARDEITKVMRANKNEVTVESLRELKYLKQILDETLRKYCPYPVLLRKVTKDYEVPNSTFLLQRGNHLIIPVAAIHYDSNTYPDPYKFDPERFHPDNCKKRHPMSWLPFGNGPRGCIAQQLAERQMLIGLLTLLRDYEFSSCKETLLPLQYDNKNLILRTKDDIKLKLRRVRILFFA